MRSDHAGFHHTRHQMRGTFGRGLYDVDPKLVISRAFDAVTVEQAAGAFAHARNVVA